MYQSDLLVPPTDFLVNQQAQTWITIGQFVPLTALLAVALRLALKRYDLIPLLCMGGSAAAMFVEPNIDVLAGCWLGDPAHGQTTMFTTFGHPFPLWGVAYIWYYGGQAFVVYLSLGRSSRGSQRATLWKLFGIALICDAIIELPGLLLGVYTYYGPQPLVVLGLPLHWEPINAAIPIAAGTVVYVLRHRLSGLKVLLTLPIVAVVHAGVMMSTLVPVTTTMAWGTRPPASWVITIAALASASLAMLCAWLATQLVDKPTTRESTPPIEHAEADTVAR
ncbi:MAG TPA: hypothetical protein VL595_33715 [Pseudonocardia sp.]|jgi:hypothetical protein|nr:hypothetical protein [Pseudonocardia sp.]